MEGSQGKFHSQWNLWQPSSQHDCQQNLETQVKTSILNAVEDEVMQDFMTYVKYLRIELVLGSSKICDVLSSIYAVEDHLCWKQRTQEPWLSGSGQRKIYYGKRGKCCSKKIQDCRCWNACIRTLSFRTIILSSFTIWLPIQRPPRYSYLLSIQSGKSHSVKGNRVSIWRIYQSVSTPTGQSLGYNSRRIFRRTLGLILTW